MSENDLLDESEEQGSWITTYADLVTLLLCFFVLLYSMSSLDKKKFEKAMESLRGSLGSGYFREFIEVPESPDSEITLDNTTFGKEKILKDINQFINEKKIGVYVVLKMYDGKIIIRVRGKILFKSGDSIFQRKGRPILDEIISIIDEYSEYSVNIKGHTDNIPIRTQKFNSNWDLSALRATSVLKYLIKGGITPKRLTATGYAHTMPLVPNNSSKNRAKNRRVEFVLDKIP